MKKEIINVIQVLSVVFSTIFLLKYLDCKLETFNHLKIQDNISQFIYKNDEKHKIMKFNIQKNGQKTAAYSKRKKFGKSRANFQKMILYSNVHCMKMVCYFQNLYYNTYFDQFFFIHHTNSSFSGALHKPFKDLGLLQLSAVVDYDGNFFNVISVDFDKIQHCFIDDLKKIDGNFNDGTQFHKNISSNYKHNIHKSFRIYCSIFSKIFSITTRTVAFSRFHPSNIMHAVHDDILPFLHTVSKHSSFFIENTTNRFNNFDIENYTKNYIEKLKKCNKKSFKNTSDIPAVKTFKTDYKVRFFFIDDHAPGLYQRLYDHFSSYKPLYRYSIKRSHYKNYYNNEEKSFHKEHFSLGLSMRFSGILVGLERDSLWYQYGFKKPQNSLENVKNEVIKETIDMFKNEFKTKERSSLRKFEKSGTKDKQFSTKTVDENEELKSFLKNSLSINQKLDLNIKKAARECKKAVLLVRKNNRLILNEAELVLEIVRNFGCKVLTMSLEEKSLENIADEVSKCDVLIGMHGSLLIMALFLPRGSLLIELYPYAVNPGLYTPFKKLCEIIGVSYRAWRNTNKKMSVWHVDRPARLGGITHLNAKQQAEILQSEMVPAALCCDQAEWFFRIYQDTVVDASEVSDLIKKAFESKKFLNHHINQKEEFFQRFIDSETFLNNRQHLKFDNENLIYDFKDHIVCLSKVENVICTRSTLFNTTIEPHTMDNICIQHSSIELHIKWSEPLNINLITYNFVFYEIWVETKQGRISGRTIGRFKAFTNHYTVADLMGTDLYVVWVRACMDNGVCGAFSHQVIVC